MKQCPFSSRTRTRQIPDPKLRYSISLSALAILIGCGQSPQGTSAEPATTLSSDSSPAYNGKTASVRVSLGNVAVSDSAAEKSSNSSAGGKKEDPSLSSVMINVADVKLRTSGGSGESWLSIGATQGAIDLMKLKDGVALPVSKGSLPVGQRISQIRLVLADSGNHIVMSDGSLCQLDTPSAQQSGLKLLLQEPVLIEDAHRYEIRVDFDKDHSLVYKGNGGCLLKPVLKVDLRSEPVDEGDDNSGGGPGDDSGAGNDNEQPPMPTPEPEATPAPTPTPYPDVPDDPNMKVQ